MCTVDVVFFLLLISISDLIFGYTRNNNPALVPTYMCLMFCPSNGPMISIHDLSYCALVAASKFYSSLQTVTKCQSFKIIYAERTLQAGFDKMHQLYITLENLSSFSCTYIFASH